MLVHIVVADELKEVLAIRVDQRVCSAAVGPLKMHRIDLPIEVSRRLCDMSQDYAVVQLV